MASNKRDCGNKTKHKTGQLKKKNLTSTSALVLALVLALVSALVSASG